MNSSNTCCVLMVQFGDVRLNGRYWPQPYRRHCIAQACEKYEERPSAATADNSRKVCRNVRLRI